MQVITCFAWWLLCSLAVSLGHTINQLVTFQVWCCLSSYEFRFHCGLLIPRDFLKHKDLLQEEFEFWSTRQVVFSPAPVLTLSVVSNIGISFHIFGEAAVCIWLVLRLFHLKIGIFNYFELKVIVTLRFCHYYRFSFLIKYLIFIYAYNVFRSSLHPFLPFYAFV